MTYPEPLQGLEETLNRFLRHKSEMGTAGLREKSAEIRTYLQSQLAALEALPPGAARAG